MPKAYDYNVGNISMTLAHMAEKGFLPSPELDANIQLAIAERLERIADQLADIAESCAAMVGERRIEHGN